jgi:hypothetical protein
MNGDIASPTAGTWSASSTRYADSPGVEVTVEEVDGAPGWGCSGEWADRERTILPPAFWRRAMFV